MEGLFGVENSAELVIYDGLAHWVWVANASIRRERRVSHQTTLDCAMAVAAVKRREREYVQHICGELERRVRVVLCCGCGLNHEGTLFVLVSQCTMGQAFDAFLQFNPPRVA